jgi:hypothetical protein
VQRFFDIFLKKTFDAAHLAFAAQAARRQLAGILASSLNPIF